MTHSIDGKSEWAKAKGGPSLMGAGTCTCWSYLLQTSLQATLPTFLQPGYLEPDLDKGLKMPWG